MRSRNPESSVLPPLSGYISEFNRVLSHGDAVKNIPQHSPVYIGGKVLSDLTCDGSVGTAVILPSYGSVIAYVQCNACTKKWF